jgi:hypothetical protein
MKSPSPGVFLTEGFLRSFLFLSDIKSNLHRAHIMFTRQEEPFAASDLNHTSRKYEYLHCFPETCNYKIAFPEYF